MQKQEHDNLEGDEPTCARAVVYRDKEGKREFLILEGNTGRFALIGGAKDEGDRDLKDTLKRELLEEVGFELKEEKIIDTGITRKFTYTAHNDRMGETATDLNFIIKLDPNASLRKTKEIRDYHWMTFEEACDKISFDDLKNIFIRIQELL